MTQSIRSAAVRWFDGSITVGRDHAECFEKGDPEISHVGSTQGFMTRGCVFVSRKHAGEIAFEAGQLQKDPKGGIIYSEDFWEDGPYHYNAQRGYHIPTDKEKECPESQG